MVYFFIGYPRRKRYAGYNISLGLRTEADDETDAVDHVGNFEDILNRLDDLKESTAHKVRCSAGKLCL